MNVRTFSFALLLAFFAASCNNDTPSQSATTEETTTPEAAGPNLSAPQGDLSGSAVSQTGTTPSTTPGQTTPASASSGKINPPHGQPGHQCGTPVGAPLDGSAPASKSGPALTVPTPAPSSASAPSPASAQPVKVAPGTNPPHGQPGHVCGTPVGAPLESKPKN